MERWEDALSRQLRRLELRTVRPVVEQLAGAYRSTFRGAGLELAEVVEYRPGDDVRSIDWNVTARRGRLHRKSFLEERELSLYFLVDVSASVLARPAGREELVEAVALLGAAARGDRVGALLVSDRVEQAFPPRRGRLPLWQLLRSLLALRPAGGGTDLGLLLRRGLEQAPRRSLVVVLSDALGEAPGPALRLLGLRHDTMLLALPALPPPESGLYHVQDAESGARQELDFSYPPHREAYRLLQDGARERLRQACADAGIDHAELGGGRETAEVLGELFRRRRARRGS